MKTIWFIDKDTAPIEEYFTQQRAVRQAQYFQEKGYKVKVICSALVHNSSINHLEGCSEKEIEATYDDVPFVFVKTPAYKGNGIKRIYSYFYFSLQIKRLAQNYGNPDIICHNSKIPFDIPVYWFAKKIRAKYIIDVQDLWPRCFELMGYLSHKNPLLKLAYKIEEYLYSKANHVVFTMVGCQEYIKDQRYDVESGGKVELSKIHYVNNGIDLDEFYSNLKEFHIEDCDLLKPDTFKFIYLGSIRQANNLDALLDAAIHVKEHKDIVFLVYGGGPDRERLEQRVQNEGISNVIFKDKWILPKYVPYVLSKADVNLLNYSSGWGHYGGSMNKMILAFASGKPLLCNAGLRYSDIRDANLGVDKSFADSKEYAETILSFYNMSKEDYDNMCKRVKDISKHYDNQYLCGSFAQYCDIQ